MFVCAEAVAGAPNVIPEDEGAGAEDPKGEAKELLFVLVVLLLPNPEEAGAAKLIPPPDGGALELPMTTLEDIPKETGAAEGAEPNGLGTFMAWLCC